MKVYSVRYLLESEELDKMQAVGLIPDNVAEIIGMQDVADSMIAGLHFAFHAATGGPIQ